MRAVRAALAFLALAGPAWAAKAVPPSPSTYVHNEGVVRPATAERLSAELRDFERATGHQFVVALFQSLEGEDLEAYVNRVFKAWRIGDAKRDDGLLLALFLKDRRWRVEVGYGLEGTLTDLEAAEIMRSRAVPLFKSGDFDAGVLEAARSLVAKLEGRAPSAPSPEGTALPWDQVAFFAILLLLILATFLMPAGRYQIGSGGSFWYIGGGDWGGGGGGGGFGGFSGGGGSSGGGGASGGW